MYNATVISVAGQVVDAPQLRRTGDTATTVASFRMASTARRFDRGMRQWVDGDTMFFRVNCWRHLGENVAVSLDKGDPVLVHGRLVQREYEVDGKRHRSPEIEAYAVGPDLARGTTVFTRRTRPPGEADAGGTVDGTSADGAVDRTDNQADNRVGDRTVDEPALAAF